MAEPVIHDGRGPARGAVSRAAGRRRAGAALGLVALLALAACATRREAPSADRPPPAPPDLTGQAVLVLPVQPTWGEVPAGLDAELEYWLGESGPGVRWVFPPALERALARSPGLGIHLRSLAVSTFLRAEVRRIGDPLFGDLTRLGALVDARYALVPVAGAYVPGPDDGEGRVEVAVALIDTIGGAVLWYGVVGGEPGEPGSVAASASAAQALARTLFPRRP